MGTPKTPELPTSRMRLTIGPCANRTKGGLVQKPECQILGHDGLNRFIIYNKIGEFSNNIIFTVQADIVLAAISKLIRAF